jgi:hypothetical protein
MALLAVNSTFLSAEQAEKAVELIVVAEVTTFVSFVHEEKVLPAMEVHAGRWMLVIPV